MIILPCLEFFFYDGYVCYVFLWMFVLSMLMGVFKS